MFWSGLVEVLTLIQQTLWQDLKLALHAQKLTSLSELKKTSAN